MARFTFQRAKRVFGASNPGLAENDLTNVRQVVEPPPGPHRDLLTAQGYPFGGAGVGDQAFRTTHLSDAYLEAMEAGLFDKLDFLGLRTGTREGILANMVPGGTNGSLGGISGAGDQVTVQDYGVRTDGVEGYLNLELAANRNKYTQNDACIFAFVEEAPEPEPGPSLPLIGVVSGSHNVRFFLSGGASPRMNSLNSFVFYSADDPKIGLWIMQRTGPNDVAVYYNGVEVVAVADNASTAVPSSMAIGVDATVSAAAYGVSAIGYGASLNASERAALLDLIDAHRRRIKTVA